MNVTRCAALTLALAASACLDLDPTGKVFACQGSDCEQQSPHVQCSCGPVPATCDGTTLITETTPACLADGGCLYRRTQTQCPSSCSNGSCDGDRCLGILCDTPPLAMCMSATALRSFTARGNCTDGTCDYAHVDVSCTCANGHCLDNPCAGVNCTVPPAPICVGSTRRVWQPTGICDGATGDCAYSWADTPCPNGCTGGACNTVRCDATTCANGCCDGDACVPFTSQSESACGTQGAACAACASGQSCTLAGTCMSCTPESDATLCAQAGRVCGAFSAVDNCGVSRNVGCGNCAASSQCSAAGQCVACTPESDGAFCARLGKNCGTVSGTDNCNSPRTASCGSCSSPQVCGGSNVCGCTAETDAAFCARLGKNCGSVSGTDNCGASRSASCGGCTSPQTCDATNVCSCTPESNAAFCSRLGKNCGTVSGTDNCGAARSTPCGTCGTGTSCSASNVCTCAPESNAAFCSRLGKNCGTVSGTDNCGSPRSTGCGSCASGSTCGASNVCVATAGKLYFTSSWQALPNTGSDTIEFKCVGTVSGGSASTRCDGSDGVLIRINGSSYTLYPGCDGNRNNCVTTVPSGATYDDDNPGAGGRLLCESMGWSLANSGCDENAGTASRSVAVVQNNPTIYGTGAYLNYLSYVDCQP